MKVKINGGIVSIEIWHTYGHKMTFAFRNQKVEPLSLGKPLQHGIQNKNEFRVSIFFQFFNPAQAGSKNIGLRLSVVSLHRNLWEWKTQLGHEKSKHFQSVSKDSFFGLSKNCFRVIIIRPYIPALFILKIDS